MASSTRSGGNVYRGVGAISGFFGVIVIIVSAILLSQALDYREELSYFFGHPSSNLGTSYVNNINRGSYTTTTTTTTVLGYEVDAPIGIAAGGLVIGIFQLFACFLLCFGRRALAIGWALVQFILLIGVIVCFALGVYFEVYSRKLLPGYGYGGYVGLSHHGSGVYKYNANVPGLGLGYKSGLYNRGHGLHGHSYDSRYDDDFICDSAGQAYLAIMGIDIVVLLGTLVLAGCAGVAAGKSGGRHGDMDINGRPSMMKSPTV
jgi:hypothetical protein